MFEAFYLKTKLVDIEGEQVELKKFNLAARSLIFPILLEVVALVQAVAGNGAKASQLPQRAKKAPAADFDFTKGKANAAEWVDKLAYIIANGVQNCDDAKARVILESVENEIVSKLVAEILHFNFYEADSVKKKQ